MIIGEVILERFIVSAKAHSNNKLEPYDEYQHFFYSIKAFIVIHVYIWMEKLIN